MRCISRSHSQPYYAVLSGDVYASRGVGVLGSVSRQPDFDSKKMQLGTLSDDTAASQKIFDPATSYCTPSNYPNVYSIYLHIRCPGMARERTILAWSNNVTLPRREPWLPARSHDSPPPEPPLHYILFCGTILASRPRRASVELSCTCLPVSVDNDAVSSGRPLGFVIALRAFRAMHRVQVGLTAQKRYKSAGVGESILMLSEVGSHTSSSYLASSHAQ